jgi:hypothetical protein
VTVAILASPIVWLHYLALLIVPIARASPRLSPLWLVTVARWLTPGTDSEGTASKMALVVAATIAIGVAASHRGQLPK